MNKKNLDIKISPDKLSAFLSLECKESDFPTSEVLRSEIKQSGINFGVHQDKIDEICTDKQPVQNVKIASGISPVKGHDAQLIWHLQNDINEKVVFDETGLADYKHARSFCEVNEGDEIVSKLPSTKGKPGRGVTGEELLTQEKEIELPAGENIRISDDGLTLYATAAGILNFYNGKIDISNIYKVDGDVSFNTGNVKYDGKVVISGDVRSGFRVEATDTIIIDGDVDASDIHSKNGDIIIKMGVLGKGRARIIASGKIHCGFIQDAEVKAGGDIDIDHYIINSDVYSAGLIKVNQNEGLVRGGKVFGEKGLDIKEVGSPKKINTILGIGLNRNRNEESEINKLIKKEDELFNRFELLSKKERFLKLLFERPGKLSKEKQQELNTITQDLESINRQISEIDEKKKAMSERSKEIRAKHKIKVENKLHKGVSLSVGSEEIYIDKLYEKVVIYQDLDNIVIDDIKIEEG